VLRRADRHPLSSCTKALKIMHPDAGSVIFVSLRHGPLDRDAVADSLLQSLAVRYY
jgi:hypothetical protein